MGKTIRIAGNEYRRKNITEIIVGRERAAIIHHKEMCIFGNGIIHLKLIDGTTQIYYVGRDENSEFNMIFYDSGVNSEQRIFFLDETINREWETFFVYLFDEEEGAFMLFAERSTMNIIGALYGIEKSDSGSFVGQMALNVASLIETSLFREIMTIRQREKGYEVSLITEGR